VSPEIAGSNWLVSDYLLTTRETAVRILYVTFFVVLLDQISKLFVRGFGVPGLNIVVRGMDLNTSKNLLGDFVRLTYIENPGMAFSIFRIVASIGILLYLYKIRNERLMVRFPLALILGGAIGNFIDRAFYGVMFDDTSLFHGRVVDFIDIQIFNINLFGYHLTRWPVFNLADASVTVGVLLLIIFHRKAAPSEEPSIVLPPAMDENHLPAVSQTESLSSNGAEPVARKDVE
jgi:signal peptidase II